MRKRVMPLLLAAVLIVADQVTKQIAVTALRSPCVLWDGVLELTYVENTGAAWGMLAGGRWALIAVTGVVVLALLWFLLRGRIRHPLSRLAVALILAGGIGNLIDRALHGYVVDFIYVKAIDFPVFNVADCCICIGAGLLMLAFLFFEPGKERDKDGTKALEPVAGTDGGAAGQVSVGDDGGHAGDRAEMDGAGSRDGERQTAD